MPSPASIERMNADVQMKRSTWRYFQREKVFRPTWKVTRRAATNRVEPAAPPKEMASAVIATACASWAVNDIGFLLTEQPRELPSCSEVQLHPWR